MGQTDHTSGSSAESREAPRGDEPDRPAWEDDITREDAVTRPARAHDTRLVEGDETCLIREDAVRSGGTEQPAEPTAGVTPSSKSPAPGHIGPYTVLSEIAQGGMGVVYAAIDPRLERRVAVKVLPERLAGNPVFFSHFQREAKLLASLNNPNIATIYSLESDAGLHYLTMEWIPGRTLASRFREGPLPTDEWLVTCRQIAVALEAAHRNGVVHLDLKPGNVMITPDGLIKVLDFGLAMRAGQEVGAATADISIAPDATPDAPIATGASVATGNTVGGGARASRDVRTKARAQDVIGGTPGYMSPEQILGEEIDSGTDIWAFACILYECITGRGAFPGEDWRERNRATIESDPDLSALPADTPHRIRELLARAFIRERGQRCDSITKARRALEEEIAFRSLQAQTLAAPAAGARPGTVPNNIPVQLASFVGREAERARLETLLGENRLLSITGSGGSGKTRLAIEVARTALALFPDGVWFVDLAPVASSDLVATAVTDALKLKDEGNLSPLGVLLKNLQGKAALILLDNCEHLLAGAVEVAKALLSACQGLKILTTSLESLALAGEVVFHLPSLAVPDEEMGTGTTEDLLGIESVRLFVERARAANPAFSLTAANAPAVAQVCRRLDGIPLAIELAAARVKVLAAEEIAKRLDDRFRLLTSASRSAVPRHQTLRALIDWSYEHLNESEQILLRRLSLFAGGWTLDAAETICAGGGIEEWEVLDLLTSLIDKSLVETDAERGQGTGQARYRMLETIREYARSRLLEKREGSDTLARIREYFLALAEREDARLVGPDQPAALRTLAAENDNLRLSLDMCAAPDADPDLGWRLGGALGRYWHLRGQWNEGRKALGDLIARPEAPRESPAAANALNWAGNLAKLQGDYPRARTFLEESLAIRRRLGEPAGLAASLNNLANVLKDQGELDQACALYEEGLALQRRLGNRAGIALALNNLGIIAYLRRDYRLAMSLHEESMTLRTQIGDRLSVATSLNNLGAVAEALKDYAKAGAFLEESLATLRDLGDRWGTAAALTNLGSLAEKENDLGRARRFYEEALTHFRSLGDRKGTAVALNNLGLIAVEESAHPRARTLLSESLSIFRDLNDRSAFPSLLLALGFLNAVDGNPFRGIRLVGAAHALLEAAGRIPTEADVGRVTRALAVAREELGEAGAADAEAEGRLLSPEQAAALALGESIERI